MSALLGCDPAFIGRCEQIARAAASAGILIRWTSGLRTWDEQAALYAKGRDLAGRIVDPAKVVTFAPPGSSWHNYGVGADFVLLAPNDREVTWNPLTDRDGNGVNDWLQVGSIAESLGCEWGGRWPRLRDLPHIQYRGGLTLDRARTLYLGNHAGLPAVWAAMTT